MNSRSEWQDRRTGGNAGELVGIALNGRERVEMAENGGELVGMVSGFSLNISLGFLSTRPIWNYFCMFVAENRLDLCLSVMRLGFDRIFTKQH